MRKKSKLQTLNDETQKVIEKTNAKIYDLGLYSNMLNNDIENLQELFDIIRNMPTDKKAEFERAKEIRLSWKQQAEKIERDYKHTVIKNASKSGTAIGIGVAVAAFGPTAAMGVATTFGVASTGTAISALSGAAATNAALAWLGGGALAAGGGGIAAGQALLALAGPIGWAIGGLALLSSAILLWKAKEEKEKLVNIFSSIGTRDIKKYELAIVELNERMNRITDERLLLVDAYNKVKTFGSDYEQMSEEQQYELGTYVNLMLSSTQLIVEPIIGLQPKYTENDFNKFYKKNKQSLKYKYFIISLANLLYKIKLDDKDKKILWEFFKRDKKFLSSFGITKKDFDYSIMEMVYNALDF